MKSSTKRERVRAAVNAMPMHDRFRCKDLQRWMNKKYRDGGLSLRSIGMLLIQREFDDVLVVGAGWYQKEMEI